MGIGNLQQVEDALDIAVLAEAAVEGVEHHIRVLRPQLAQ